MNFQIMNDRYSLIPDDIYFYSWKTLNMGFHTHDKGSLEIDYIVDGSCSYYINGKYITLNKRSLLLHNGGRPHDYHVPESCLNLSITCIQRELSPSSGTLSTLLSSFPGMQDFLKGLDDGILLSNAGSLYPLAKEINDRFQAKACDMHLNLLTNKLLIDCFEHANYKSSASIYTEQIKDYIRYHYFSIQKLDEIAQELSLNKVYMERVFKQETGDSIWNYLNNIRLENAVYYLTQSNIPIGDIDELVGIHSRQNFYLLFKNKYQVSPSQYRKNTCNPEIE